MKKYVRRQHSEVNITGISEIFCDLDDEYV